MSASSSSASLIMVSRSSSVGSSRVSVGSASLSPSSVVYVQVSILAYGSIVILTGIHKELFCVYIPT